MTEALHAKPEADPRIIVALDFAAEKEADALVAALDPAMARLKIGKEMFTRFGPEMVRRYQGQGFEIFLDLKFHDIPNTVARAVSCSISCINYKISMLFRHFCPTNFITF